MTSSHFIKPKTKRNKEPMADKPQSCDGSELGLYNDLSSSSYKLATSSPQFREEAKTVELVSMFMPYWASRNTFHYLHYLFNPSTQVTEAEILGRVRVKPLVPQGDEIHQTSLALLQKYTDDKLPKTPLCGNMVIGVLITSVQRWLSQKRERIAMHKLPPCHFFLTPLHLWVPVGKDNECDELMH